ncbi:MAG: O-antigen ligase family protein [Acidobacteriales bacterium]|nr:O-antigen ligase family protein [Terriglobales bacterium]
MPFQDCILGKTPLGYLGSSLSSIPLAMHGVVGIFIWSVRRQLTISRRALLWSLYIPCISLIYLLAWGPVSHDGSVVYKGFSGTIVLFLWLYTVFSVDYTPSKGLKRATYIAFFLLIVGVVMCDSQIAGLAALGHSQIFHITPDQNNGRWRGFSNEPSMFSATVLSLGIASAYLSERKIYRNIFVILTFCLLLLSQSKGGILIIGLSGFVVVFLKRPSFLRLITYLSLCMMATSVAVYFVIQQATAINLFQATGTFATRISLAIWTLIVVLHHPLGVGLSGFYEAFRFYLPPAMDWLSRVSPFPLDFTEVQEYVNGNMATVPLDTKCFFFEYVAMFGLPFLVAYLVFSKKVLEALLARKQDLLMVGFVFLMIGMSTYINGATHYAGFYLTGLAYRQYLLFKKENRAKYQVRLDRTTLHSSTTA